MHILSEEGKRHINEFKSSFTNLINEEKMTEAEQCLDEFKKSISTFKTPDVYFIRNIYWDAVDLLKITTS